MDHTVLDFLAEGCIAGKTLLRMVARANAIIAEVRRRRVGGKEGEGKRGKRGKRGRKRI